MTKPTEVTRWATAGGADVTEPASGTKDSGYVDAGVPDAGELNWNFNRIYLWELWLQAFESTAHTWTALQTFNNGITLPVGSTLTTDDIVCGGELDVTGLFAAAANASIGGTLDVTGILTAIDLNATNLNVSSTTSLVDVAVSGGAAFNTGAFSGSLTLNGVATFNAAPDFAANPSLTGTTPAIGAPVLDKLTPASLAKAWAVFANNNTNSPVVNDSLNVDSIVQNSAGYFTVTFGAGAPMLSADYVVNFTDDGTSNYLYKPEVDSKGTTGFRINIVLLSDGSQPARSTFVNKRWGFTVHGRQS